MSDQGAASLLGFPIISIVLGVVVIKTLFASGCHVELGKIRGENFSNYFVKGSCSVSMGKLDSAGIFCNAPMASCLLGIAYL